MIVAFIKVNRQDRQKVVLTPKRLACSEVACTSSAVTPASSAAWIARRNRIGPVAPQGGRSSGVAEGIGSQAAVGYDGITLAHGVGSRRAVGLIPGRAVFEPVVQRGLAAVEVGEPVLVGHRLWCLKHRRLSRAALVMTSLCVICLSRAFGPAGWRSPRCSGAASSAGPADNADPPQATCAASFDRAR